MPDYGVSGTTRRYTLIVGMLVALATVPTLVVMAVGAASVDSPASFGQDLAAELYVLSLAGTVYRIDPA